MAVSWGGVFLWTQHTKKETEWQWAVCMSLGCQHHCQGLSESRSKEWAEGGREGEEKGGAKNAHGFNKTLSGVTWALSPSSTPPPPPSSATPWHHGSNIQRAPSARLRESRLTSPISYCLSVSLIWSSVGQLPFWTAESRHILAGRLAANKSQPGIYSPFPFIYDISQYCYYEYICI